MRERDSSGEAPDDRPWSVGPERRFTIRPLGGAMGCLGMILFSVLASVLLTLLLNALLR